MKCQNCGSENEETHIYCDRCGAVIVRPFKIDEAAIRGPKQDVVRAIDRRYRTDAIMPVALVWLIIVLTIMTSLSTFTLSVLEGFDPDASPSETYRRYLPGLSALSLGSFISDIIILYVYYMLVKRENDHYSRERELRTAIISLVRAAATTPERQNLVGVDLMTMGMMNEVNEKHHGPWFWVLAAALPTLLIPMFMVTFFFVDYEDSPMLFALVVLLAFVAVAILSLILQLIMFRFLGNSTFDHSSRWSGFSITARNALSKLGFSAGKPFRTHRLPERSFVLYVVLTLFTGIFFFYWLYVLVKDPNEHFRYQWEFEDNLLSAIGAFHFRTFKDGNWVP